MKSTHICHLPLDFLTITRLANHSGWSTSLIKPVLSSLSNSDLIASRRSGENLCNFCFTGTLSSRRASLCTVTSLGTAGMSDACHANTSVFARRKAMRAFSYLGSEVSPMKTVFEGSSGSRGTSLTWSFGLGAALDFDYLVEGCPLFSSRVGI